MKKFYFLLMLFAVAASANAQSAKQVQWVYSTKKIADKVYEVHMTATVGSGYHMYAQNVGIEGPLPTTFKFVKNPLATQDASVKEVGALIKKYESAWSGSVNYYEKTVDFVTTVKLRGDIKTSLAGSVEFMVCNEKQCLPPSTVEFKVNVGG